MGPQSEILPRIGVHIRRTGTRLIAYAALTKIYTVVPLVMLAYGFAVSLAVNRMHAAAASAAMGIALCGGYAYNDLRDEMRDRFNRPQRPLPAGLLTSRQVTVFVWCTFAAALLIVMFTQSLRTVAFLVLLIFCLRAYSDRIKYVVGLKNVFVGVWCGVLPLGAALDHAVQPEAIVPVIAAIALFVTQKEMVADVYDARGDEAGGVRTIAVRFGPRVALAFIALLNLGLLLLARASADASLLISISRVATVAAQVNLLSLAIVAVRTTPVTVRAYLEVQKLFLIGGCVALFIASLLT